MRQTLDDIRRKLAEGAYKNEEHVRFSLVARILNELAWDIWNPNEVNAEFVAVPNEDSTRVDLALFATPYAPSVYIEIKSVGKLHGQIGKLETQLRDYNRNNTAIFSVLTDGRQWRFYYSQTGGEFSKKCFKTLDVVDDDIEELESSFQTFISKGEISNGNAKQAAESYLQLSQKQRAMGDVLPQADKMIREPPYPSLPQAIVGLVEKTGLTVTLDEAAQFAQEFMRRKPIAEQPSPILKPTSFHARAAPKPNDIPAILANVLDVCREVYNNGREYREATKIITRKKKLRSEHTVPDACTRAIGLNTLEFRQLLRDKAKLIEHLNGCYPAYADYIRESLE